MARNKRTKTKTDKVTGLSANFPDFGGQIVSDKSYGVESAVGQAFTDYITSYSNQAPAAVEVEFEMSKDFIAITIYAKSSQTDNTGDFGGITRTVYEGNFSFKKGRLAGGTVTGLTQSWPDGVGLGGVMYRSSTGGERIANPNSFYSFGSAVSALKSPETKVAQYLDYDQDGSNDDEVLGLGEQAIRDFGGGRFFYENWWDNPFASNLI
jgi:hypothetical protein